MDKEYWENYYINHINSVTPSDFAIYVYENYISKQNSKILLELGCGNGRDCLYFSKSKEDLDIYAIDQSAFIINELKKYNSKIKFLCDDFTNIKDLDKKFDFIYSRFTLHSITEYQETKLLEYISNYLNNNGYFFVEARSVKDDIFGIGEKIDLNTYIHNGHSRRFIVLDELCSKIQKFGLKIVNKFEGKNFAIYKDENPFVIRIIVKK